MIKKIFLSVLFPWCLIFAQEDHSNSWEDFFSYNNVKDLVKVDNKLYALSDNAVFVYDFLNQEIQKISSVQGLSGEKTSSIHYSTETNRLVIGYESGLIEVVDSGGEMTTSADIVEFDQSGKKSINAICEHQGTLYLSTSFAVVEYDIVQLEFGDTFFIGNNGSDVSINEIAVFNDQIYAATERGILSAPINSPHLIDFNNWTPVTFNGNFKHVVVFNDQLYTVINTQLFEIRSDGELILIRDFFSTIRGLKSSSTHLSVALDNSVIVLDLELVQSFENNADEYFDYQLNTSLAENNSLLLATRQMGVLFSEFSDNPSFLEIHPEGPVSNDVFSVTARNNHVWVVYGGYDASMAPIQPGLGFSHFDGDHWYTHKKIVQNPFPGLVDVTIDPSNENKVYLSSFGTTDQVDTYRTGGLFVVENNEITRFYNHLNSPLENLLGSTPNKASVRISGAVFDRQGSLWLTNIGASKELKKVSNGIWTEFDINAAKPRNSFGLYQIIVDRFNTIWMGTRNDGLIAYNENGNRIRSLTTTPTQGNLPNLKVLSLAVDSENRIWIGTLSGLVVFNNAFRVFDADLVDAQPIIFEENGTARRLLADEVVQAIAVDGANNKWFGTSNGGVTYTTPSGLTTIANFNKQNSPLPSDRIVDISVDMETGKVFFATDQGMVAYNSGVAPFGVALGEVYAYPNPARKFHNTVTINGRNGTNLPKGTNVKILDVAGNLVYETNVLEGQELQGGKIVWNKTNLAGKTVASGIYIVLLSNAETTETSSTKIAVIN